MSSVTGSTSPFKVDSTESGMCGVTLMNNQVGIVMAKVMAARDGVQITDLPSMIRVDAPNRMDFVYDDISDALGDEAGSFGQDDFEENMSAHYGKMIHEEDRTIMFARPEDMAEFLGWDLPTVNR